MPTVQVSDSLPVSLLFSFTMLKVACSYVALLLSIATTNALLPTARIDLQGPSGDFKTLLASQARYGPLSPMKGTPEADAQGDGYALALPLDSNPLLCNNLTASPIDFQFPSDAIVLVPRGECTYQTKTLWAQTLGASAVIIYNTMSSRYSINTTSHEGEKYPSYSVNDILWPVPQLDYDCDIRASARIPASYLSFSPLPYNPNVNDPLLSGHTNENLCKRQYEKENPSKSFKDECPSQRCLISEEYTPNATDIRVCCAWDLHLILFEDVSMDPSNIKIPSVFVTMEQGDELLSLFSNGSTQWKAAIASRWRSSENLSSLIIWMLGVAVATFAAYYSARDYRRAEAKLLARKRRRAGPRDKDAEAPRQGPLIQRTPQQEETLELEPIHAVFFVGMASTSLFVLFYFKIYGVVKVMYAFGCSNAVIQVILQPLVIKLLKYIQRGTSWGRLVIPEQQVVWRSYDFGDVTNWDALAAVLGYIWGMTWLYMAFFVPHPDSHTFFWVSQDILGACMCITFMGLIQLNNIQVGSILLIVGFLYDIFFVFITPYLFQESIMITVATSGGPPKADALYCEKYPSDSDCQGGDPLPMLLTIPRLGDYQGGSSLLGLGDIVLPGLLLSFAARFDAAKSLVAVASGGDNTPPASPSDRGFNVSCCWGLIRWNNGTRSSHGSYFFPVVVAYAIGLLMANAAVYIMEMGQPALLYLVPATLGTISYLGMKRQELKQLWDGPKILRMADEIVYGPASNVSESQEGEASASSPTVVELPIGGGETSSDAFVDEDDDDDIVDQPLLSDDIKSGE